MPGHTLLVAFMSAQICRLCGSAGVFGVRSGNGCHVLSLGRAARTNTSCRHDMLFKESSLLRHSLVFISAVYPIQAIGLMHRH